MKKPFLLLRKLDSDPRQLRTIGTTSLHYVNQPRVGSFIESNATI